MPFTESDVGVVIMIATKDGNGDTSDDRKFAFYCTRLYSSCTSVFGDDSDAFKPFTYVDISQRTRAPTPVPSPGPTPVPTLAPTPMPTPLPTTFDTVKVTYSLTLTGSDAADLIETNPQSLTNTLAKALNLSTSKIKNLRLGNITTVTEETRRRLSMDSETDSEGAHKHGGSRLSVRVNLFCCFFGGNVFFIVLALLTYVFCHTLLFLPHIFF